MDNTLYIELPLIFNNLKIQEENEIYEVRNTKGNIPIDIKLYKKYANLREIFDNERVNYEGKINLKQDLE